MTGDRQLRVARLITVHKRTMLYGMIAFVLVVVVLSLAQYRLSGLRSAISGLPGRQAAL